MTGPLNRQAERVLILAPTEADARMSESILERAGVPNRICRDLDELEAALPEGAGAILLTDAILSAPDASRLLVALHLQPAWSDLPTVLLSSSGVDSPTASLAMESLGNVTILERPVRVTTLVSAIRSAIRARRRQYELRDQIDALRQSEDRFQIVSRTVHESIWDLDLASGRFWSSEQTRPLFGKGREFETGFDAWRSRRHPEDAERVSASFRRAIDNGDSSWSEEYRFRRLDGNYVSILDRGHIVRNAQGLAIRVVGALMDMTERKRGEAALALHAAIVESSADAIVSKSLDGIILSWNSGAERLFGYAASEAIGQSITFIIPPELRAEEAVLLDRIRRGQRVEHFETTRRRKDGSAIVVSLSLSPVLDPGGRVIGASKVARDISARRIAEQTMDRQAKRLKLLLETAEVLLASEESDAMLRALFARLGAHLRLDAWAYWRIDGREAALESSEGIAGETLAAIDPRTAEISPVADCGLRAQGLATFVLQPLIAEGRARGALLVAGRRSTPLDADEQEFLRTICHYVTAAGERIRLIRRLKDSDRRKDEFLAMLAHELRNPLAPVRNSLEIMHLAGNDPGVLERARETIDRQIGQMVRLIDDLLDVSRITRGRLELRTETVGLETILQTALETARPLIDEAGHQLIVEGPDRPVELVADPVRLAQVLSNLLNNAAKYTERGGTIHLTTVVGPDVVTITVRDTGVGIAAEALPGVFDLFNQVDRTLERSQGGLGIGLTLVKRLVEMHGGQVEADSGGPGQGSAFTVRLPVLRIGAPRARAPETAVNGPTRRGRRILIADDNRDAADTMALVLSMQGNEVRTVHDGRHAVTEAGTFEPDVVLLDIGMPLLNGYDAARSLRESPRGEDIVLVALTGWGQDDDKRKATEAGFDLHFTKPLDPAELGRIVRLRRQPGGAFVPDEVG